MSDGDRQCPEFRTCRFFCAFTFKHGCRLSSKSHFYLYLQLWKPMTSIVKNWSTIGLTAPDEDYETMMAMYKANRFSWALFAGHLMMEKLLKAFFVKVHDDYPPYTHNLLRLAESAQLNINENQKVFLVTVTAFNINARYDDYKKSFQKKCTPEFTLKWINELEHHRQWIKKHIKQ